MKHITVDYKTRKIHYQTGVELRREKLWHQSVEDPTLKAKIDEVKKIISGVLKKLTCRERIIICHRYGLCGEEEKTLQQIGELLGCSKQRVMQIHNKALLKLKGEMELISKLFSCVGFMKSFGEETREVLFEDGFFDFACVQTPDEYFDECKRLARNEYAWNFRKNKELLGKLKKGCKNDH